MARHWRHGSLFQLAESWRTLGYPGIAAELDDWRQLFAQLDNEGNNDGK